MGKIFCPKARHRFLFTFRKFSYLLMQPHRTRHNHLRMKNSQTRNNGRLFFVLIPALLALTHSSAQSDCYIHVNAYSNGVRNPWLVVYPGDTVNYKFEIFPKLTYRENPGLHIVMIGLNEQPLGCIYKGYPIACNQSNRKRDSAMKTITAPSIPGIYYLFYKVAAYDGSGDTCNGRFYDSTGFGNRNNAYRLGAIQVIDRCENPRASVFMNGQAGSVKVLPGAPVTLDFKFEISKPLRTPPYYTFLTEQQIEGSDPVRIFEGNINTCPQRTINETRVTVNAPSAPGRYKVFVSFLTKDLTIRWAPNTRLISQIQVGTIEVVDQCQPMMSVSINGHGSFDTVRPGSVVSLGLNYKISKPASCPGCREQIQVGIGDQPLFCVYDGLPPVCPGSDSGTKVKTFNAPAEPGDYGLYFNTSRDKTCVTGSYNSAYRVGTLTVRNECQPVVSVNINNLGNNVTVAPGAALDLEYSYVVSNPSDCRGCISQVLLGLDNRYLDCLYNGAAAACPASTSGKAKKNLVAPAIPGIYKLYYKPTKQFDCKSGQYSPMYYLGTITVRGCGEPQVSLNMNATGNKIRVRAGEMVDLDITYSLSSKTNCPGCRDQLLLGIGSQYIDCIFNGTVPDCPASAPGTFKKQVMAPLVPGLYTVFYHHSREKDCLPERYRASQAIGTIIVD